MAPKLLKIKNMEDFIVLVNKFIRTLTDISLFRRQMNLLYLNKDIIDQIRKNLAEIESSKVDMLINQKLNEKCDISSPFCLRNYDKTSNRGSGFILRTNDLVANLKPDYMGVDFDYFTNEINVKSRKWSKGSDLKQDIGRHSEFLSTKPDTSDPKERCRSMANEIKNPKKNNTNPLGKELDNLKHLETLTLSSSKLYQTKVNPINKPNALINYKDDSKRLNIAEFKNRKLVNFDKHANILCYRIEHKCCEICNSNYKTQVLNIKNIFFSHTNKKLRPSSYTRKLDDNIHKCYQAQYGIIPEEFHKDKQKVFLPNIAKKIRGSNRRKYSSFSHDIQPKKVSDFKKAKAKSLLKIKSPDIDSHSLIDFNNAGSFENIRSYTTNNVTKKCGHEQMIKYIEREK